MIGLFDSKYKVLIADQGTANDYEILEIINLQTRF